MTENRLTFDNKIEVYHQVEYYETMTIRKYNIISAVDYLNEAEQDKVIKYICKLTNNRVPMYKVKKKTKVLQSNQQFLAQN